MNKLIEKIDSFTEKYLAKFLVSTVVAIPTLLILVGLVSIMSQSKESELIGLISELVLVMITVTLAIGLMNIVSMRSRNKQTLKFMFKIVFISIFIFVNAKFVLNENNLNIAPSINNLAYPIIFVDSYILAYLIVNGFVITSKKILSGTTEDVSNRIKLVNQVIVGCITTISAIFAMILLYLQIVEKL
ncbi:hypothetical protein [Carnobacterium maltaromaticum]|uniref:hypothetical protein n=1 Tax=Carnobacterium maltaromaticum TaxID=2751 RepID=UPI00295F146B|nr:hypothetical protein [Carnobacterium maltaromaticum]